MVTKRAAVFGGARFSGLSNRLEESDGYCCLRTEFRGEIVFDLAAAGPGIGFTGAW